MLEVRQDLTHMIQVIGVDLLVGLYRLNESSSSAICKVFPSFKWNNGCLSWTHRFRQSGTNNGPTLPNVWVRISGCGVPFYLQGVAVLKTWLRRPYGPLCLRTFPIMRSDVHARETMEKCSSAQKGL